MALGNIPLQTLVPYQDLAGKRDSRIAVSLKAMREKLVGSLWALRGSLMASKKEKVQLLISKTDMLLADQSLLPKENVIDKS